VVPGLEMFIEQAVKQFEIWTGEAAPRPAMLKAAMEALEHDQGLILNHNHNHDRK
jgi:shikimate 5-dehydrogenase